MTGQKKRGPPANRELALARARFALDLDEPENRPTVADLAKLFGVTPRHIEKVMRKHQQQVVADWAADIAARMTANLAARDDFSPQELQAYKERRSSREAYRAALAETRAKLRALRAKKGPVS